MIRTRKGIVGVPAVASSPKTSYSYTGPSAAIINPAARRYGLDPFWLAALLFVESRFDPNAHNASGAEGEAQILLPAHPGITKAQADNPRFAIPWAASYLAQLRRRAGGSIATATKFYNTGPNADRRTLDTAGTAYLDQVQAAYRDLRRKYAGPGDATKTAGANGWGPLAYPLGKLGRVIGLPYQGTHRDFGNWESDNAIDLAVPAGTPVYAVAAGTIGSQLGPLDSGSPQLAGQRLHLATAADEFYYAHLSKIVVKAGQRVRRGQLIGYSGAANGVQHLHIAERATFDPKYQSDPNAANVSFWSSVGKAAQSGFDAVVPGAGAIGAGARAAGVDTGGLLGPIVAPLENLAKIGTAAGRFMDDPAYPFLWLAFMLLGFAILYVGVTRLFGVRPASAIMAAQAVPIPV